MTQPPYILAIDHGTSGIKAAIISVYGEIRAFEFEPTPIYFFPGGGAEQNPDDWWNALIAATSRLIQKSGINHKDISAIAVSSTFSTTVAVDKNGSPLMNALTWMDSRGAPYVKKLMKGFPSIDGYGLPMILKWLPKTGGGPTLSGKDDIAHVLLIKNEFPHIYDNTYLFLPSKDYLNFRLTGRFAASYDSMQLFWVSDIRDVNHVKYDDRLIQAAGIDREKLPDMTASTAKLGKLRPDVAQEIGIDPDTDVIVSSPDHQTACIGSGAVADYAGHIYIGTSSWVQAVVPFKKTDVFHSIASFPTAVPGKYQSVNEQDMAGGCLDMLWQNLLFYQNVLNPNPQVDPYRHLDAIAKAVPPGSDDLIFLPWLNGERTPVDDTSLRGGFYNMSKATTQNHLIRSVLEGVSYNTKWSLTYVERFVRKKLSPLNFVGGGAQSDLWCQILADILDRDIRQVEYPMQANARGAAFIAAVGLGAIDFSDIPGLIRFRRTYKPQPENRAVYDRLFPIFLKIYKKNRSIYRKLNAA